MKKYLIGIMLFITLGCLGTTYGRWNKKISVQMNMKSGNFEFRFDENGEADAAIVSKANQVSEIIEGVEMHLSQDKKEAELIFTKSLPLEPLMDGQYIRVEYPLEWDEGAVFPRIQEVPDFSRPDMQVYMEGKVRGVYADGNLYEFTGGDQEFHLEFDMFYQTNWRDEKLYGTVYLTLTEDAAELLSSLDEMVLEIDQDDLLEIGGDWDLVDEKQGIMVEYSGVFSIFFDQMNRGGDYENER